MNFKNILNSSLIALSLVTLAGCNSDVEDVNSESTNSTFEYGKVEVTSTQTYASNERWPDIKDKMLVGLRTCFIDTVYREDIVGEDFSISSDLGRYSDTSNSRGCISWTEELDFDYLQDETFYKVDGKIKGLSNFKGVNKYSLAINPWTKEVVDLDVSSVFKVNSLRGHAKKFISTNNLNVEKMNVTMLNKQFFSDETILNMEVSMNPKLSRRGLDGSNVNEALTAGSFNVKYFLIAKSVSNDSSKILSEVDHTVSVSHDGELKKKIQFRILEGVEEKSKILVGVQVTPNHAELAQYSGVLTLNKLTGKISGDLVENTFNYENVKTLQDEIPQLLDPDYFGFVMDQIVIKNGAEGGANKVSSSQRTVAAKFNINMVDSLVRESIKHQMFKVDIIDVEAGITLDSEIRNTKSGSGDINFRVTIPFKSYETRRWKEYLVRVSGVNSPYDNIVKERIVYINPWLKNDDFGIDSKDGEPVQSSVANTPQIDIKNFTYKFVGNEKDSFKMNKDLDLVFQRAINLRMRPKLKFPHDYQDSSNEQPYLMTGEYKLRFLVLAPKSPLDMDYTKALDLNDFYTLTGDEVLVDVEDGYINKNISLPVRFNDLAYLSFKNVALIEITPTDNQTDLKAGYFVGHFTDKKTDTIYPLIESGNALSTGNLKISKTLIRNLRDVKSKLQKDRSLADSYKLFKQELVKGNELVPVFDNTTFSIKNKKVKVSVYDSEQELISRNGLKLNRNEVKDFIHNPSLQSERIVKALCDLLYDKDALYEQHFTNSMSQIAMSHKLKTRGAMYNKCVKSPVQHISLNKLAHVTDIIEQPEFNGASKVDVTRSEAKFISEGSMFQNINGTRQTWFAGLGGGGKGGLEYLRHVSPLSKFAMLGAIGAGLDIGMRFESYDMDQISHLISDQDRLIHQIALNYDVDKYKIKFTAEVKKCVLVGARITQGKLPLRYTSNFRTETHKVHTYTADKRVYVCNKNTSEVTRDEDYYFMRVKSDTRTGDEFYAGNTHVNTIRGSVGFNRIRKDQIDNDKNNVFVKVESESTIKSYNHYFESKGKDIKLNNRMGYGFPGLLEYN